MNKLRVRFAPSPTGYLHIGSARTALFNWLLARRHGGTFILRIEDTDLQRNKKEFEEDILDGLKWLGMDWDEGPGAPATLPAQPGVRSTHTEPTKWGGGNNQIGRFGPYYQSQRNHIYLEHIEALLKKGIAYEKEGAVFCKVPTDGEIVLDDLIRGKIKFQNKDFKDQVLRKSDGSPTYQFAVVVDDALMGITHVIRGEDHISNTPKQMHLYQALGFPVPQFGHIPLILAPDRSKLSKRHGAVSITEYRKAGYLPESMINYLALLGWTPEKFPNAKDELMTQEQVIGLFDLKRVGKAGAIFDVKKLSYINGQKLRAKPLAQIREIVTPYLSPDLISRGDDWVNYLIECVKDSLELGSDMERLQKPFMKDFVNDFKAVSDSDKKVAQVMIEKINQGSDFSEANLANAWNQILSETGIKKKDVLMPLRQMLSGSPHGMAVEKIAFLLGQAETLRRLQQCLSA